MCPCGVHSSLGQSWDEQREGGPRATWLGEEGRGDIWRGSVCWELRWAQQRGAGREGGGGGSKAQEPWRPREPHLWLRPGK